MLFYSTLQCPDESIVLTNQPLYDDELFEVRLDSIVGRWSGSLVFGATTVNAVNFQFPRLIKSCSQGTTFALSTNKILKNGKERATIPNDLTNLLVCITYLVMLWKLLSWLVSTWLCVYWTTFSFEYKPFCRGFVSWTLLNGFSKLPHFICKSVVEHLQYLLLVVRLCNDLDTVMTYSIMSLGATFTPYKCYCSTVIATLIWWLLNVVKLHDIVPLNSNYHLSDKIVVVVLRPYFPGRRPNRINAQVRWNFTLLYQWHKCWQKDKWCPCGTLWYSRCVWSSWRSHHNWYVWVCFR